MAGKFYLGVLFAVLSASAYGFNTPITRVAYENGVIPVEAVLIRATVMMVLTGAIAGFTGRLFDLPRSIWPSAALLAASTAVLSLSYLSSVAFIPVGLSAIIFFTFPIHVLVLAPLFEGRGVRPWRFVLAILAFAGLALAIGPTFETLDLRGVGLALIASFAAVSQFFTGHRIAGKAKSAAFLFWVHLAMLPVMAGAVLLFGHGMAWFDPGPAAFFTRAGLLAVLALSCTYTLGYNAMMRALKYAAPSTITPVYNVEPIVSIAAAGLLLGERLNALQYSGGAIVLAALIASGIMAARQRRQAAGGLSPQRLEIGP